MGSDTSADNPEAEHEDTDSDPGSGVNLFEDSALGADGVAMMERRDLDAQCFYRSIPLQDHSMSLDKNGVCDRCQVSCASSLILLAR